MRDHARENLAEDRESGSTASDRGTCFGLEIHSRLEFQYLRPGSGQAVRVLSSRPEEFPGETELLQTWEAIPGGRPTVRLARGGPSAFEVEIGTRNWFRYDESAGTFMLGSAMDPAYREALFWGTPAAVAIVRRGDLVLHAATLDVGGAGVLICGPGETGKTTLAAAFHVAGHRMLSDDLACCRVEPEPSLLPGPALARLRRDTAEHLLKAKQLHVLREEPARIHAAVPMERRGSADPVPLRLVVLLKQEPGPLGMTPLAPRDALRDLWAMSFWLPFDEDRRRCFRGLGRILARVPAARFTRPRDWAALPETVAYLAARIPSA